ncbi:MAG: WYL domain-containing protein [Clostridiales bacterium]|nr:WYL domain-containing protein [Clostridiales bacterium]
MIYTDDNYYLLAYHEGKFKHFRVDRMESVETIKVERNGLMVPVKREGKDEFDKIDMSAYTKYTFSMYGGDIEKVTMVFQNRMLNVVLDRFGKDILAVPEDKNHFRVTVPVAVSQQFFGWVFGLGKYVRIVGPEHVKEMMQKSLADIAARYE